MTEKTMFITGIGNGIGRALAVFYTQLGWRVAGLDPDAEALDELRDGLDGDLLLVAGDAGREADVIACADRMSEWLDGAPLTCLVNNAGIADPYSGPLEDLSLADFQSWIDASLTAAFLCSRACLPLLRRGESGCIVNISSTRAVMSEPECFGYAAAKGGLDALTHALAVSLGPDIRVNAIRPGWIETRNWQKEGAREKVEHRDKDKAQHPAGRVGRPADIVATVDWLIGSHFVTGEAINVDGGMTRKMIYEH
ncbi:SDR family NAD(P)-dependent oxidoreductase [Alteriqipengyuania lutimaris]|uniref:SDR family NAD(P)-dependent oxidoreductase n=1 Tax=Alteriqipengyuania lutimaris TaxID=1538146 RepID=A0A395LMA6_9SPHN|nr:SDR family oxidoreductase [Alteriqipengyuania lutimaris]MBB3034508.1 NAD(P)-dependent dehydrogenase (short-subunit alcohol dehydrogenase family) [Alteriqipengyuania lutimaris]RDS76604.1 SDR family NAD(P)-dependent oxidoreductase [Alteriqipengyuania lutimaris]